MKKNNTGLYEFAIGLIITDIILILGGAIALLLQKYILGGIVLFFGIIFVVSSFKEIIKILNTNNYNTEVVAKILSEVSNLQQSKIVYSLNHNTSVPLANTPLVSLLLSTTINDDGTVFYNQIDGILAKQLKLIPFKEHKEEDIIFAWNSYMDTMPILFKDTIENLVDGYCSTLKRKECMQAMIHSLSISEENSIDIIAIYTPDDIMFASKCKDEENMYIYTYMSKENAKILCQKYNLPGFDIVPQNSENQMYEKLNTKICPKFKDGCCYAGTSNGVKCSWNPDEFMSCSVYRGAELGDISAL